MKYSIPKLAERVIKILFPDSGSYSTAGDLEEVFYIIAKNNGISKARRWYIIQVFKAFPAYINRFFYWFGLYFFENVKVSFRSLLRSKYYSGINIVGLSAGMVCSILILLYARNELTYDSFYDDVENIYRVAKIQKTPVSTEKFAATSYQAAAVLKELFPEVIQAGRARKSEEARVFVNSGWFLENKFVFADNGLVDIFNIHFILGDPKTSLTEPKSLLITSHISEQYFGLLNPLGNKVTIDTSEYTITGVIEDAPANTHLKYNMIASLSSLGVSGAFKDSWDGFHCQNYIKLAEDVDPKDFEERIKSLPQKYASERSSLQKLETTLFLQPIRDIHLHSDLKWETETPGNINYVYIMVSAGLFILLLSGMNFINITTARMLSRYQELGVRKIIGANRKQIIGQFFTEVFLIVSISVIIGILTTALLLPFWSTITGIQFNYSSLFDPTVILLIIIISILTLLAIGFYPAFYMSSFNVAQVLSGKQPWSFHNPFIRKCLVVFQFAIAIVLISGTYILFEQIYFMKNKVSGFEKEEKVVLEFDRAQFSPETYKVIKSEFLKNDGVKGATFSSSIPGRWFYYWVMHTENNGNRISSMCNAIQVDMSFFEEYKLELLAGRQFTNELEHGWVINEEAVKAFGWESPEDALGKFITFEVAKVIGVVKNFNYEGLQKPIGPLAIFSIREDYRYLTLRISTEDIQGTLSYIENTFKQLRPNSTYSFFFLNEDFNKQYKAEENISSLSAGFTVVGLLIAFMGLFGLTTFLAEKRTKELGIRKVMGASVHSLIFMLSKEYVLWLVLGLILAIPATYEIMEMVLSKYAFRIQIDSEPFIFSALTSLVIILLSIGVQSYKTATINPVLSLRDE